MKIKLIIIFVLLQMYSLSIVTAHPGSGIVVDKNGHVYFTDTGKGVWKIDNNGKLTFLPSSRFHWLAIDVTGNFASSPKSFGEYFEKVITQNNNPTLIMSSDFPLVVGKDGNIYYAYTRPGSSKIIRRTREGKETVLASHKIFQHISDMAVGADGSLYITEASNANANTIRKITMSGVVSIVASYAAKKRNDSPPETLPSYCRGLAIDAKGIIYVAATGSRSVLRITPQGKITTILRTSSPWSPTGLTIFNGEVYMLEWKDAKQEELEEREAWIPRVRKIGRDGKVKAVATVFRN